MKRMLLGFTMVLAALDGFAQGTIIFNNRNMSGTSHIYAPLPGNLALWQIGNGSNDSPSGSTDWAGYTLIGARGLTGQYGASDTLAQLLGANGSDQPESSLVPQGSPGTFRTGAAAGYLAIGPAVTLTGIPLDSPAATFEVVAWDDSSGLYSTWALASVAASGGVIAAADSGTFTVFDIGGNINAAPDTAFPSFNLSFGVFAPEPSRFALAGLGVAMLMIARRRAR